MAGVQIHYAGISSHAEFTNAVLEKKLCKSSETVTLSNDQFVLSLYYCIHVFLYVYIYYRRQQRVQ